MSPAFSVAYGSAVTALDVSGHHLLAHMLERRPDLFALVDVHERLTAALDITLDEEAALLCGEAIVAVRRAMREVEAAS